MTRELLEFVKARGASSVNMAFDGTGWTVTITSQGVTESSTNENVDRAVFGAMGAFAPVSK